MADALRDPVLKTRAGGPQHDDRADLGYGFTVPAGPDDRPVVQGPGLAGRV